MKSGPPSSSPGLTRSRSIRDGVRTVFDAAAQTRAVSEGRQARRALGMNSQPVKLLCSALRPAVSVSRWVRETRSWTNTLLS